MYQIHQRASYKKNLDFVKRFQNVVHQNKEIQVFKSDLFKIDNNKSITPDIMIMDLPYEQMVNWSGRYSESKIHEVLFNFVKDKTIIAIIRKKTQKLDFRKHFIRLEKFKVGHRIIEILTKRL